MNTPRMFAAVIVGILVAYGLPLQLEGVLVRSFAGRNLYTAGDYFMTRNTATLLAARIVITAVTSLLAGYMAARIARTDGVRVVAISAAALTMMLIYDFTKGEFAWGTPIWLRVVLVLLTGPVMLGGAAIRSHAAALTAAEPPPTSGA